jgi:hypothetical protein
MAARLMPTTIAKSQRSIFLVVTDETFLDLNVGAHGIVNVSNADSTWSGGNMRRL